MSDFSRRTMLSGGLKAALGAAGGLLLPWQGGGAFALPDIGGAAGIPVTTGPLPVSAETLAMRSILARQYEVHLMPCSPHGAYELRNRLWRECALEYKALARVVLERPVQSWSQAVEMAEICWRHYPKVWVGPPTWEQRGTRGVLALQERAPVDRWARLSLEGAGVRRGSDDPLSPLQPFPHLIEAVLTLGGGQRREPTFAPDVQTLNRVAPASEILELHGAPWLA